jgi:PIN domain nuclease of toxin-antitoxin system
LLLDTCTFLWLAEGSADLSEASRESIVDPENEVYLSPASAWEIAIKHALGRLRLKTPPAQYVPRQRRLHRIEELPIDEASVLQIGTLPEHHRDPFDRLLVAQAIAQGCVLVTPDPLVTRYPVRTLW